MCKQYNTDKECFEEGYYEDGAFIAIDDDIPEPPFDSPDSMIDLWNNAKEE